MQLFSRRADALARVLLWFIAALLVGVPLFLIAWVRTPYVTGQYSQVAQPIPFDHRHHVVDDGIDCLYCHIGAERSPHAGVPPTELCLNCHSQIWNSSPALGLVWSSRRRDQPIPWQRVNYLPDFVFFNHSIHVGKGVACATCHGRVDEMARVYQAAPLTMGWCVDCHRRMSERLHVAGLTDCTTCHR